MKKLFFAFSLFVVSLAFGQMETVKFDRKLVYEQDTASSKDSKRSIRELGVLLELNLKRKIIRLLWVVTMCFLGKKLLFGRR